MEDTTIKYEDISELIKEHLTNLKKSFYGYIPENMQKDYDWIEYPFTVDVMTVEMS